MNNKAVPLLEALREQGLYRELREIESANGAEIVIDGKTYLNLASNNYLGLTTHPRVVRAATEAIRRYGTGSGASRLISGTMSIHAELEQALAKFKQTECALVFSTGYMANLGLVTSLVGAEDLVISDRLCHASIIDACRLSKAKLLIFPHRDAGRLKDLLKKRAKKFRRTLVITESVFSMDGDIAPLDQLWKVCKEQDAWLLIDDAHGTGVLGPSGRGGLAHFKMMPQEGLIQMGTLSKALGSLGGYVAGSRTLIDYLINKARSFIYTTALPPASAAAALEAIRVIQDEPQRLKKLWSNVALWRDGLRRVGLPLVSDQTPILPVLLGDTRRTSAVAEMLRAHGIYAPAIRPPTVPKGQARIRTTVMATHSPQALEEAFMKMTALVHRGEL
ncbi:MAG: 8-amino-7-oxononanoate synthase [Candidatus Omnitrophica bacterium]|nr:8-amino-7-oxononanoate synthase [Candidatus Omnitrophota bacterium]